MSSTLPSNFTYASNCVPLTNGYHTWPKIDNNELDKAEETKNEKEDESKLLKDWQVSKDVIECVCDLVDRVSTEVEKEKPQRISRRQSKAELQLSPAHRLHKQLFGDGFNDKKPTRRSSAMKRLAAKIPPKFKRTDKLQWGQFKHLLPKGLSSCLRTHAHWLLECNVPPELIIHRLNHLKAKELMNKSKEQASDGFVPDKLMWGKLAGHKWWPCKIVSVDKEQATAEVIWFYNNTTSLLPFSKLLIFEDNLKSKGKKLTSQPLRTAFNLAKAEMQLKQQLQSKKPSPVTKSPTKVKK